MKWQPLFSGRKPQAGTDKHATEMLPISKDAVDRPDIALNLTLVYAWTNELDLAFKTLYPLTKIPYGVYYGDLTTDSLYEPLRKDPRYQKLLAEFGAEGLDIPHSWTLDNVSGGARLEV